VFFGKEPSTVEILNDIHPELIILLKVIGGHYGLDTYDEFSRFVRTMPSCHAAHNEWKHWDDTRLKSLTPAQRGFRFFYCIKNGFSSQPTGGYSSSPFVRSRYNMNTDFTPHRQRLHNAIIETLDFRTLVQKYNRPGLGVTFFADPPYWVANKTQYYDFVFTQQDHADLKHCCDSVDKVGNRFLLTYDDIEEVIDTYRNYYVYRTDPITYMARDEYGRRSIKKPELFVTNYDIAEMIAKREHRPVEIPEAIMIRGQPSLSRIVTPMSP